VDITGIKAKIHSLGLFLRFSAIGGTIALPLLGAGTVAPRPGISRLLGMVGVGVAVHVFGYVFNDVVDLPIDRHEPRRVDFPLVRGTISPGAALAVAVIQIPVALLLTYWADASVPAYAALIASIVCLALYDVWGKRVIFPPLTDFVQGLGWGGLGVYGAYITAGHSSTSTTALFVYVVIMIVMANGVHGSVRDLENDFRCGVRSTAIMLGARPGPAQTIVISPALKYYAQLLNGLLIAVALGSLITNRLGYDQSTLTWTIGVVSVLAVFSLRLLKMVGRRDQNRQKLNITGMFHLLILYLMMIFLFVPGMGAALSALVLLFFHMPLLTHSWFYGAILSSLRRFSLFPSREKSA
jgi:4-hydroxybenzoate polyprenyltransferase